MLDNIFGTKSLDSILSNFEKTKGDLEVFNQVTTAEADKLHAEATEKLAQAEAKRLDVQKATRVHANITKFLEG